MNAVGIFTTEFMEKCFEKLIREHIELLQTLEKIEFELNRTSVNYSYRLLHPEEDKWSHTQEFQQGYLNGLLYAKDAWEAVKEAGKNVE